jgi:20S proteasome alpha/beta subunit
MTLLVALRGQDGIVLAADSRGTFGDPRGVTAQNDSMQKAHVLSQHVAALVAGAGEVGDMVIDGARQAIEAATADTATEVMNILRETVRQAFENWFPSIPAIQPPQLVMTGQAASRPDLAFLVAGYEPDGSPRIYHLLSQLDFSPMLSNYGFAVQGIAQYALYLLNRLYEADRTVEELTALAVYVITETASQDGKVGGPVKVITIEPGAGCKALDQATVERIQADNDLRSTALRDSFYTREVSQDGDGAGGS